MNSTPLQKNTYTLDSIEAVKFLVHLTNVRFLYPFWGQESSLSEAAQFLNVSKSLMNYWQKKLLKLNLIFKIRDEKRGKHVVPIYRSVAEVFAVPLEKIPLEWQSNLLVRRRQSFDARVRTSFLAALHQNPERWQVRLAREGLESTLDILPNEGEKSSIPYIIEWGRVRLGQAQVNQFRKEFLALAERFSTEQSDGAYHLFKLLLLEENLE